MPERVCEGLLVEVLDPGSAPLLGRLREAMTDAGLELPLVARGEAGWVDLCADTADRLAVSTGVLVDDDELIGTARCAAAAGIPVEWALRGRTGELAGLVDRVLAASAAAELEDIAVSAENARPVHGARVVAARLRARGASDVPLVLRHRRDPGRTDESDALVQAAIELGAPLCDGLGDAVSLTGFGEPARDLALAYRILQGARLRTSWTEFISCPSCGRTLFDLEETTARIKSRTGHLRGVKIAVMGCIVNGPGEMADADFGYVGSGPGEVNLYVGQELVARRVPEAEADDRLVDLIREHGRWTDPT